LGEHGDGQSRGELLTKMFGPELVQAVGELKAIARLLKQAGAQVERLDSGCCGLAGNFGFQRGRYDVSVACAEHVMLPRLRDALPETVVLVDGFSCRTRIQELDSGGREAMHRAELLAGGNSLAERYPERSLR
jgi:Fe-S oxidoreductase